jgi:RNA polymerase sigma-B factor
MPRSLRGPVEQRSARLPVTEKVAGSNPVRPATQELITTNLKKRATKWRVFSLVSHCPCSSHKTAKALSWRPQLLHCGLCGAFLILYHIKRSFGLLKLAKCSKNGILSLIGFYMIENTESLTTSVVSEKAPDLLDTADRTELPGSQVEAPASEAVDSQPFDVAHNEDARDQRTDAASPDALNNKVEKIRPAIGALLRRESDRKLFVRLKAGDQSARDILAKQYLHLAYNLASKYRMSSEPQDDLNQVASLGLIKAIDRFDPDRGLAFSTFAVPTITGELKRHFRDSGWAIHVPRGLQELSAKVKKAKDKLEQTQGGKITNAQIAGELNITEEEVEEAQQVSQIRHIKSLDAPRDLEDEAAGTLGGTLEDPEAEAEFDLKLDGITLERAMHRSGLSARDRAILTLRLAGWNQKEIAGEVGISQMHVSRCLRAIVAKITLFIELDEAKEAA